jgi:hypothetical protein
MSSLEGTGEAAQWCAQVPIGTAEGRVRERVRVALEEAVRRRVSTVVVDRDGQARISGAYEASQPRLHGRVVGAWTFAPEPWEHIEQDEIDWAVGVLVKAWVAAQRGP